VGESPAFDAVAVKVTLAPVQIVCAEEEIVTVGAEEAFMAIVIDFVIGSPPFPAPLHASDILTLYVVVFAGLTVMTDLSSLVTPLHVK